VQKSLRLAAGSDSDSARLSLEEDGTIIYISRTQM